MGKPSRRQRKQLRGKRVRAESGVASKAHSSPVDGAMGQGGPAQVGLDGVMSAEQRGWSSWPVSVKLLVAGILALVLIGLYRRYTEDLGSRGIGSPDQAVRARPAAATVPLEAAALPK